MSKEINYSDGIVERQIEQLLKDATDLKSTTDIASAQYRSWPIRYHLSSIRSNCIRHLCFSGLDVLELGAGMGAMSRFVAESAAHLTVVEGTQQRFDCLKARLRDLSNWDGVVANYQDFRSERKYDVVCFFGVLEYAGRYIQEADPFAWAIQFAKSFLREDGVLLITIENKNGLKYFAGATEDHFGELYHGICGYAKVPDIKTFSRKEMLDLLFSCGFPQTSVYHLSPDYKCTRGVLSDAFVSEYPVVAANIAGGYESEDYMAEKKLLFPERLAMVSLAESGLVRDFTNSYLFIAQGTKESSVYKRLMHKTTDGNILGSLYTSGRINEVRTDFVQTALGMITQKSFVVANSPAREYVKYNFAQEPFYSQGIEVSYLLLNYAYYGKKKEFMTLLYEFIQYIFTKHDPEHTSILPANAIDAIVRNAKLINGDFITYDHEYIPSFPITKSYFILRNLCELTPIFPYMCNLGYDSVKTLYLEMCRNFSVMPNLKDDIDKEVLFQGAVSKRKIDRKGLVRFFDSSLQDKKGAWRIQKSIKILGFSVFVKKRRGSARMIKLVGIPFVYEK